MTFRMPYGYGTATVNSDELKTKATFYRLHPEVQKRFLAMAEHLVTKVGVPIGVGTGWRVQPAGRPGFASPGNSWHEGVPVSSMTNALAIDTVPSSSWNEMERVLPAFGFRSFRYVNNEPWHIQPAEIPAGRNYATTLPALNNMNFQSTQGGIQVHGFVPRPANQPARILDTRGGQDIYKLAAHFTAEISVPGSAGMAYAIVNLVSTESEGAGFFTAWPEGPVPNESKLNWSPGQVVANEVTVGLNSNGRFLLRSNTRTHVVIDLVGFYKKL